MAQAMRVAPDIPVDPAPVALHAPAAPPAAAGWNARLELRFDDDAAQRTVLGHSLHVGPLRVQKALYPEGPRVCHVVIVHPPGGIAGGDRLETHLDLGPGTHALITTPGATKWYRTAGPAAQQETRVRVGAGAVLEWLPQETIVFNRAVASNRMEVDLDAQAGFVGWDTLCFGRTTSGERFDAGSFRQRWQIRQAGALLWNEAGSLRGGDRLLSSAAGFGGMPVCATMLAAGRAVPTALIDAMRERLTGLDFGARVAVTRLPLVVAVRYLGPSAEEAREAFVAAWSFLRPLFAGRQAQTPRLWGT
jgi:urease accessory protein